MATVHLALYVVFMADFSSCSCDCLMEACMEFIGLIGAPLQQEIPSRMPAALCVWPRLVQEHNPLTSGKFLDFPLCLLMYWKGFITLHRPQITDWITLYKGGNPMADRGRGADCVGGPSPSIPIYWLRFWWDPLPGPATET